MNRLVTILLLIALVHQPTHAGDKVLAPELALAVEDAFLNASTQQEFWPGFLPQSIPLAVFDGQQTYLFRHPNPPPEFARQTLNGRLLFRHDGRHPAVTANTSAEIGGVLTGTVLADAKATEQDSRALAAIALHETFHVFQRQKHPGWQANEASLFLYPVDDVAQLRLRRAESAALQRALHERDKLAARCWAKQAMQYRAQRFALLDKAFAEYERRTELNEGLANYIQLMAAGSLPPSISDAEFPPGEIRHRSYVIGPAVASLLDRFASGWKDTVNGSEDRFIDEVLSEALAKTPTSSSGSCGLTEAQLAVLARAAERDIKTLVQQRQAKSEQFAKHAGWRLVIETGKAQPLWPQGFDPLNVETIASGLLHSRFLKLGNDRCTMSMVDEAGNDFAAVTLGAGAHPLFNGVKRVEVAGLATVQANDGMAVIEIKQAGFELSCKGQALHIDAQKQVASILFP